MLTQLGLLMVETAKGDFSVQVFVDEARGREQFGQLQLLPGQAPFRATYVSLDWEGKVVEARSRMLPEEEKMEKPDGWKLGTGPLYFPAPSGLDAVMDEAKK